MPTFNLPRIRKAPSGAGWPTLFLLSSVRGRIILTFGLTVLILAGVALASAWQFRLHRSDMAEAQKAAMAASDLEGVGIQALLQHLYLEEYVQTGDETFADLSREASAQGQLQMALAHAREIDEHDTANIEKIETGVDGFSETAEDVLLLRQAGDVEGAAASLESLSFEIAQLQPLIGAAVQTEQQEVTDLRRHANSTAEFAFWLLVISSAAGGALGIIASLLVARSILKPLSSLESTARAVAVGDLQARAPASGPRELAHLGETLNSMMTTIQQRTEELGLANQELRQRNRQLLDARAQAATDALTGLSNHRAFQERIRDEVSQAQEKGTSVGLIMLDIDVFKRVNDSLGHLTGDQALRDLALVLAGIVRREDAYRYGGDEFAVLLPAVDRRKTTRLAERLRRAVESRTDSNGNKLTVSVGVASFPDTAASAEELIYGADAAMYWAKSAGKNRVGDWSELLNRRTDGTVPWYAVDSAVKAPEVVAALVAALAAKDPITSAHTARCSWYALKLSEELGLSEEETSVVRLASLLHDIGKIAVPDEVLFKPGPLNEQEWAQMKQHPGAALHVLSQIRTVANATPAILHHHEHYDGSGYPDSLTGEEIPIASRILLVTDAFDAMTTDRPYRKAMPLEAAIEELNSHSDSQFDPSVVDAFLKVLSLHGAQPLGQIADDQSAVVAGAPSEGQTKQ